MDDGRSASVYRRSNGTFVVGEQMLDDGLRVAGAPYLRLGLHVGALELGEAVARTLAENKRGASMRDDEVYDRTWPPVLELVGVRTSSEFHTGISGVQVVEDGRRVRVYALDNLGSGGGFELIEPPAILRNPSHEELGRAVLEKARRVSYDAHITRAADWSVGSESPISLEEWSAAASAVGLVSTRTTGYFVARAVRQDGEDASFEWDEGQITVRAPDVPALLKMIELAAALDAVVQGDDGEEYRRTPEGGVKAEEAG